MERKEYIQKKVKELSKHLSKLDETRKNVAKDVIDNLAFQMCALSELRELIVEGGFTEMYQNGANQYGTKQSSNVATYNKLMVTYNQTTKLFVSLFSKDDGAELKKNLEFGQFLGKAHATKR